MRRLAALLAFLLVPVMIVTGPAAPGASAAAADDGTQQRYGPSTSWGYKRTGFAASFPQNGFKCAASSNWTLVPPVGSPTPVVRQSGVQTRMKCSLGVLVQNQWDTRLAFEGRDSVTGNRCSAVTPTLDEQDVGQPFEVLATPQAYYLAEAAKPTCQYDRVCWSMLHDSWFQDVQEDGCLDVAIGGPKNTPAPTPAVSCSVGQATRPVVTSPRAVTTFSTVKQWQATVTWRVASTDGRQGYGARARNAAESMWTPYVVTSGSQGMGANQGIAPALGVNTFMITSDRNPPLTVAPNTPGGYEVTRLLKLSQEWDSSGGPGPAKPVIYGAGYIYGHGNPGSQVAMTAGTWTATPPNGTETRTIAAVGRSADAACTGYWGARLVNDNSSTTDDPIGELVFDQTTAPVDDGGTDVPPTDQPVVDPPEEGCGFKATDPSTWLEAGMCAAVGLLGEIIGVLARIASLIGGLVTALLDGLGGLIRTLFVPSPGFIDGKVDAVKDSWADTPPGQIVGLYTGFTDGLAAGASAGCQGPALRLDLPMTADTTTLHLLSACGWAADFSKIVRTGLTVAAYLGALLAAVRLLLGALGLNAAPGTTPQPEGMRAA